MKKFELAFIGSGNMAEALVKGIVQSAVCEPGRITVTDTREERLDYFRTAFAVKAIASNRDAAKGADVIVLAVKPQVMGEVLRDIQASLGKDALVVSIAAGTTTSTIENVLGGATRVVRVMPNTPALVGAGASAVCAGRLATDDDVSMACKLMEAVGMVVRVKESDMDAVTALSGSGPAYVFYLMEIMLEGAKRMNLDPAVARQLAYATIGGAAKLAMESADEPGVLRERVTSKGGTTAAALETLRQRGVFDSFVEALLAAQKRSQELSKAEPVAARKKDDPPEPQGPGLLVLAWRFLNTLLMAGLLVYVAARIAVGTDGLKGIVREKIEDRLGLKVSIEKVKSDWRFDLTLKNVEAKTTNETSRAGLQVQRVEFVWDVGRSLRDHKPRLATLACDGGTLTFERAGSDWVPDNLAGIGDWVVGWLQIPVATDSNAAPGGITVDSEWAATTMIVSNMEVVWSHGATNNAGEVRGLAVESSPLATPRRYLRHYTLTAVYAEAAGVQVRNADIEWIDAGTTNVVLGRAKNP